MNIYQITVFLENSSGKLAELTKLLADNNIDIRAISIAETAEYGLARLIVDDAPKASSVLLQHGDMISMTPVWAVEVPDQPGGLSSLLNALAEANVNIEYMYSLFTHRDGCAYMVMRISDEPRFLSTLGDHGIKLMSMADLGLK